MTFAQWLLGQMDRKDLVGEVARLIKTKSEKVDTSFERQLHHFQCGLGLSKEVQAELSTIYREYKSYCAKMNLAHEPWAYEDWRGEYYK